MGGIADMVARLIASGAPPDVAAVVVAEAFTEGVRSAVPRTPVDETAERRRAKDRDRKRLERGQRLPDDEWYPLVGEIVKRDNAACQYCGDMKDALIGSPLLNIHIAQKRRHQEKEHARYLRDKAVRRHEQQRTERYDVGISSARQDFSPY